MSYFVHNPYYFANVTDKRFESTSFGQFFIYNHLASSICGLLFIPLVFYMLLFQSPSSLRDFRRILLINHSIDLLIWVIYSIGQARTRYVNEIGLHTFIGPITWFSFKVQMVAHVFHITAMIIPFVVLPLPLWYRDQMLRNGPPSNSALFVFIGFILVLVSIAAFLIAKTLVDANPTIDYGPLWFEETPIPPLIVIDSQLSKFAFLNLNYNRLITLSSFLVAVVIAGRSYWFLKSQSQEVGRLLAIKQFTRLIFAQMLIPTFGLFTPLCFGIISVNVGKGTEITQHFMLTVLTWIPSINSITTLIFIVPYRQVILLKLRQVTGILSHSSVLSVQPVSATAVNNFTST